MSKEKVMAIIKSAGYGCTDVGICLHFTVYIREGLASSQMLFGKDAESFIYKYGVFDVHELNGKPVWLRHENRMMTDLKPCIITGN